MHRSILPNSCQSHYGVKRNSVIHQEKPSALVFVLTVQLRQNHRDCIICANLFSNRAIVFRLGFFTAAWSCGLSLLPPYYAKKKLIGYGMHQKSTPIIITKRETVVCSRCVDKEKYFIQLAEVFQRARRLRAGETAVSSFTFSPWNNS